MLRIANLEAGYGSLRVIKGVSLHVSPGEVVAIIGPNGAGKTTLLATIAGLIKPWTGEISLQGRRIEQAPPEEIVALGCSLVPEGRQVFGPLTVKENLLLGGYVRRREPGERRRRADAGRRLPPVRRPPRTRAAARRRRSPAESSRCSRSAAR